MCIKINDTEMHFYQSHAKKKDALGAFNGMTDIDGLDVLEGVNKPISCFVDSDLDSLEASLMWIECWKPLKRASMKHSLELELFLMSLLLWMKPLQDNLVASLKEQPQVKTQ